MQLIELITRAYRHAGVIDEGVGIEDYQVTKGVEAFNDLIPRLLDEDCGRALVNTRISSATSAQTGYFYLVDTSTASVTLTLPTDADEGQMFGVGDAQERFDEHAVTIQPGSNLFEGVRGISLLQTEGFTGKWFFRQEAGWTRIQDLAFGDDVYFPASMIDPLTTLLAAEIAPVDMRPDPTMALMTFVGRYGSHRAKRGLAALTTRRA